MKKEFYNLYSIIGNISEIIENIKKSDGNGQYLINIDNAKIAKKIASYHEKKILSSENIVHFIQNNITHKSAEKLINDLFKSRALNAKQHGELMLQYYIKQDLKRVLETEIEEKENTVPKTNPKNATPATALKSSAEQLQSSSLVSSSSPLPRKELLDVPSPTIKPISLSTTATATAANVRT